jgi:anti-sigma factor RsiW
MEIPGLTLSCRELVELVTDYHEGVLAPEARARFEQHLAVCSGCQSYVDQMRATIRAVGVLRETDITEPARGTLMATFRSWKKQKP